MNYKKTYKETEKELNQMNLQGETEERLKHLEYARHEEGEKYNLIESFGILFSKSFK